MEEACGVAGRREDVSGVKRDGVCCKSVFVDAPKAIWYT